MKKRMFLSTILMTLVLLVALTTATFAWYTATAGKAGFGSGDVAQITTSDKSYSIGNVTLNVELSNVSNDVGPTSKELGPNKVVVMSNGVEREVAIFYKAEGVATWTISATMNKDSSSTEQVKADAAALASIAGDYYLVLTATNARITNDRTSGKAVDLEDDVNEIVIKIVITDEGQIQTSTGQFAFAVNSNVTNEESSPVVELAAVIQATNPSGN